MSKKNVGEEADFCEAYKSQILNDETEEESPLTSILTILLLLVVIITLSIYGYNYFMSSNSSDTISPPVSVQIIEDDELKVTIAKTEPIVKKEIIVKSPPESTEIERFNEEVNNVANAVKLSMSESEEKEKEKIIIKESTPDKVKETADSTYKKQLEELNNEIDKERNNNTNSTYIEQLAELTAEIDE